MPIRFFIRLLLMVLLVMALLIYVPTSSPVSAKSFFGVVIPNESPLIVYLRL
jgi:hypothetical protein